VGRFSLIMPYDADPPPELKVAMAEAEALDDRVKLAQQRVASFDTRDGFQDRKLATIWAALEMGIRKPESDAHLDAYVMLSDLVERAP